MKRFICIIISMIFIFTLVGCGEISNKYTASEAQNIAEDYFKAGTYIKYVLVGNGMNQYVSKAEDINFTNAKVNIVKNKYEVTLSGNLTYWHFNSIATRTSYINNSTRTTYYERTKTQADFSNIVIRIDKKGRAKCNDKEEVLYSIGLWESDLKNRKDLEFEKSGERPKY